MLCAVNRTLRGQRRRLVTLTVLLGLACAAMTAHSVMCSDHMDGAMAMCLAVAETAVIAVGAAVVIGLALARRPRWLIPAPALREFAYVPAPQSVPARAGPPLLQVFRL